MQPQLQKQMLESQLLKTFLPEQLKLQTMQPQLQLQKQIIGQKNIIPTMNIPTIPPPGFPIGFPTMPSFDLGYLGMRKQRGRKVKGYVPSFGALFYKIRGKKAKKVLGKYYAGTELRKIPKGFSFASALKLGK
jgi:hypothetical protein